MESLRLSEIFNLLGCQIKPIREVGRKLIDYRIKPVPPLRERGIKGDFPLCRSNFSFILIPTAIFGQLQTQRDFFVRSWPNHPFSAVSVN
jgi:hypothetical protein